MKVKVKDLMTKGVVTAQPHHTIDYLKGKMTKHAVRMIPVVSTDKEPVGVVSHSDLMSDDKKNIPISKIMSDGVYTIPDYEDVSVAARIMRNHNIHHLIVTHEKKVIGIISSFDLMQLIEGKRFVEKNPSTPSAKSKGKRAKAELSEDRPT